MTDSSLLTSKVLFWRGGDELYLAEIHMGYENKHACEQT